MFLETVTDISSTAGPNIDKSMNTLMVTAGNTSSKKSKTTMTTPSIKAIRPKSFVNLNGIDL